MGKTLPILDIPRFQLQRGEQMVLVGPSGCGKTTMLHVIAGIRRADTGAIRIAGTDITGLSEAGRDRFRAAKIGYIFQTFNLLPGFTALENVLLGMTFARGRRDPQRAKMLLDRVGLSARTSSQTGGHVGGRAAAGGGGPRVGQPPRLDPGGRTDRERRPRPPGPDCRIDPRDLPRREPSVC